uniref:Uncharacterized protein n=1 Tax=Arundo donax TaxID=35708 RepID=A0A0A9BJP3_ARUDO
MSCLTNSRVVSSSQSSTFATAITKSSCTKRTWRSLHSAPTMDTLSSW